MWGVIAWGMVFYFIFNAFGFAFEALTGVGEIIVYESRCLGGKTNDVYKCVNDDGRIYVSKRRFKVDFDHQRVIEAGSYVSFNECVIFDRENWYCKSKDGSYNANMNDGRYSDSFYFDTQTEIFARQQTSIIVYWYYDWKGLFG
ncbi:MAG: hypothetical protein Q8K07_07095 [Methylicorpusculum sp.]|uniref:hypothetical protein n=1 Tax=Methylicorpusculum sp. TaxID=2713644 RepID=UPI00272FC432|nr:hypothetical protein [Methylicorpusculum sp.]MDP2201767.1 hypothetical protein [Methylicorpusculum sp.]